MHDIHRNSPCHARLIIPLFCSPKLGCTMLVPRPLLVNGRRVKHLQIVLAD